MDIKVTAFGTGVHSSMPVNDNAVYLLSQALAKIAAYNPPAKLTPTAKTFLKPLNRFWTKMPKPLSAFCCPATFKTANQPLM